MKNFKTLLSNNVPKTSLLFYGMIILVFNRLAYNKAALAQRINRDQPILGIEITN